MCGKPLFLWGGYILEGKNEERAKWKKWPFVNPLAKINGLDRNVVSQVNRHPENEEGARKGEVKRKKSDKKWATEDNTSFEGLTWLCEPSLQKAAWLGAGSGDQAFIIKYICVLGQVASSLCITLLMHPLNFSPFSFPVLAHREGPIIGGPYVQKNRVISCL